MTAWPDDGGLVWSIDAFLDGHPGWRRRGRFAYGPCPACGRVGKAWLTAGLDGRPRVGCWSCGDWRGVKEGLGLSHARVWLRRAPLRLVPEPSSNAPDMVADADRLDAVYGVFLRHLPMSPEARWGALVEARGLPEHLVARLGALVGPVPTVGRTWNATRAALVADLHAVAPADFLDRVPELSRRAGGTFAVLHTRQHARYFEPWRDEHGRVVALRAYLGPQHVPKYLVSPGRTGAMVHFARGVDAAASDQVPWVFTEGWMKAEVAAHAMGCVAVGLPGISSRGAWARAIEAHQRLAPEAPAYVAFDAEAWTTRPDHAVLTLDFALALEHATGRAAGFAVWDARVNAAGRVAPKGIDDAIAAGVAVVLTDRAGLGRVLGPALDSWESARAA